MIRIPTPAVTAADSATQLAQIRSYLYALSGELNWALEALEKGGQNPAIQQVSHQGQGQNSQESQGNPVDFAQLKALIIKSADIVDAYYDQISQRLQGQYVAVSQFGQLMQDTQLTLGGTSTTLSAIFENQQTITAQDGATMIRSTDAWCKVGLLSEEGEFPVYGMEIGQVDSREDGLPVYRKFARYCSDGVFLYDQNGIQVAGINDRCLTVTNAHISGVLQLGHYRVETDAGITLRWAGQ